MSKIKMTDKEFLKGVARICVDLLKNSAHSFGIDFAILNDTMIELEKRAILVGLTRKELYPDEK